VLLKNNAFPRKEEGIAGFAYFSSAKYLMVRTIWLV
jgi:hypothetical protein